MDRKKYILVKCVLNFVQPDIVMDNDDSKDGSKDEEEAVDPLEEHEKRLQLVARRRNEEKKGEADKTDEAKN